MSVLCIRNRRLHFIYFLLLALILSGCRRTHHPTTYKPVGQDTSAGATETVKTRVAPQKSNTAELISDLIGLPYDSAYFLANKRGLKVRKEPVRGRNDFDYIDKARLKGDTVVLVWSSKKSKIPNLNGKTWPEVRNALINSQFTLSLTGPDSGWRALNRKRFLRVVLQGDTAGKVVWQSSGPGEVDGLPPLRLTFARDVSGLPMDSAQIILGTALTVVVDTVVDTTANDIVEVKFEGCSQDTVRLSWLCKKFKMPKLVGLTLSKARDTLAHRPWGFTFDRAAGEDWRALAEKRFLRLRLEGDTTNVIRTQSPAPGADVAGLPPVTLSFAKPGIAAVIRMWVANAILLFQSNWKLILYIIILLLIVGGVAFVLRSIISRLLRRIWFPQPKPFGMEDEEALRAEFEEIGRMIEAVGRERLSADAFRERFPERRRSYSTEFLYKMLLDVLDGKSKDVLTREVPKTVSNISGNLKELFSRYHQEILRLASRAQPTNTLTTYPETKAPPALSVPPPEPLTAPLVTVNRLEAELREMKTQILTRLEELERKDPLYDSLPLVQRYNYVRLRRDPGLQRRFVEEHKGIYVRPEGPGVGLYAMWHRDRPLYFVASGATETDYILIPWGEHGLLFPSFQAGSVADGFYPASPGDEIDPSGWALVKPAICVKLEGNRWQLDKMGAQAGPEYALGGRPGSIISREEIRSLLKEVLQELHPTAPASAPSGGALEKQRTDASSSVQGEARQIADEIKMFINDIVKRYQAVRVAQAVDALLKKLNQVHTEPREVRKLENQLELLIRVSRSISQLQRLGQQLAAGSLPLDTSVRERIPKEQEKAMDTAATLILDKYRNYLFELLNIADTPELQAERKKLMETIGVAEVVPVIGGVIKDLSQYQTGNPKGRGGQAKVTAVISKGYKDTVSGAVVWKPKVEVEFSSPDEGPTSFARQPAGTTNETTPKGSDRVEVGFREPRPAVSSPVAHIGKTPEVPRRQTSPPDAVWATKDIRHLKYSRWWDDVAAGKYFNEGAPFSDSERVTAKSDENKGAIFHKDIQGKFWVVDLEDRGPHVYPDITKWDLDTLRICFLLPPDLSELVPVNFKMQRPARCAPVNENTWRLIEPGIIVGRRKAD